VKTYQDVRDTIIQHPAVIGSDFTSPFYTERRLKLGLLEVIATSYAEGYDVNLWRGSDPQAWISAEEWPVVRQMIESQFAWGESFKKGGVA
jgi:hypothetical protein